MRFWHKIKSALNYSPAPNYLSGYVREPFTGAWQRAVTPETPQNILAFSAVYTCVTMIADDVSKLKLRLMRRDDKNGILVPADNTSPFWKVLQQPNGYQTMQQFIAAWIAAKLLHGNEYVLIGREGRGMASSLHNINPFRCQPLVASDGSVFYKISFNDTLTGKSGDITVPSSEIIHDRTTALWHPLVGVSPIFACGASATQGIRIQANSEAFFANMSRPSGQLTAPGTIPDETAERLKRDFEKEFGRGNIGRLLVGGDGLKYEPLSMSANDAQLIEQLKFTIEDVARAFKVPMYKLGGQLPTTQGSLASLAQDYYAQTLQSHIEAIETLLEIGLGLPPQYCVRFDLDGLTRMDPQTRAETDAKEVGAGIQAPNEARQKRNLPPAVGGDEPYLQQQNYSLAALARRDEAGPPGHANTFAPGTQPPTPQPAPPTPPAPPAPPAKDFDVALTAMKEYFDARFSEQADRFAEGADRIAQVASKGRSERSGDEGCERSGNAGSEGEGSDGSDQGSVGDDAHASADAARDEVARRLAALEQRANALVYQGVWSADAQYVKGDAVTHSGSMWVAEGFADGERPGKSAVWKLAVKRGRAGKHAPADNSEEDDDEAMPDGPPNVERP